MERKLDNKLTKFLLQNRNNYNYAQICIGVCELVIGPRRESETTKSSIEPIFIFLIILPKQFVVCEMIR